jgi:hypothetical protein
MNVFTSHEFMLASTLSHIGAIITAVYGLRFLIMPRFAWVSDCLSLLSEKGCGKKMKILQEMFRVVKSYECFLLP